MLATFAERCLCGCASAFLLGRYLKVGIAGSASKSMCKLLRSCLTKLQNAYQFLFPLAITEGSRVSTGCQHIIAKLSENYWSNMLPKFQLGYLCNWVESYKFLYAGQTFLNVSNWNRITVLPPPPVLPLAPSSYPPCKNLPISLLSCLESLFLWLYLLHMYAYLYVNI